MERLLSCLRTAIPNIDFSAEQELMSGHVIDSLDLVNIIDALESEYCVHFRVSDITAANFDSIDKINSLVSKMQSETEK